MYYLYNFEYMNKFKIIEQALKYYGQSGIVGPKSNQNILSFFNKSGHIEIKDDDTPWCSAFMNAVANDLNLPKSGLLNARSWLSVGKETKTPEMGDIVILWRESPTSWKGHVGIFIAKNDSFIWLLGGNQNNEVNISKFELSKVLGYRDITI